MIDCDVHQNFDSVRDLYPYLDEGFRDYLDRGGYGGVSFPQYPYAHPEGFIRRDAIPPDGGPAGSDYEFMRDQLLDPLGIEYAILTGEDNLLVSAFANPALGSALARAYNDWMLDTWIQSDSRLKASICVATSDPVEAAAEIRRLGGHPDVVQVLVPSGSNAAYGKPQYHPIWEAAAEKGLVLGIHAGGGACGVNGPPTATGYPTYYAEYHALTPPQEMASQLGSLVFHGVFEKFPDLRVTFIEGGVAWLVGVLWRLDADYKACRMEVPWLTRLPSEIVRRHVRLTTQPLESPRDTRKLEAVLEAIGIEHLLFASDYPHWDFDDPDSLPLRPEWREAIYRENARAWYRLPVRETATA